MEQENVMRSYRRYYLLRLVLSSLIGVLIGVLFLVGREYAGEVFDVLLIAVGLMTVVLNFAPFFYSLVRIRRRGEWISLLMSFVAILLGILLMLLRGEVILLVLGIFTILLPIVRILLVEERGRMLKRELPKAIFGAFIIVVSLIEAEEIVFLMGAILAFVLAALYLAWGLLTMRFRLAALEEQLREEALAAEEAEQE